MTDKRVGNVSKRALAFPGIDRGHGGTCCSPTLGPGPRPARTADGTANRVADPAHSMERVWVKGGSFAMGDGYGDGRPADGEHLVHQVELGDFEMDANTVTNADFAQFVEATGYITESEELGYSACSTSPSKAIRRTSSGSPRTHHGG